MIAKDKIIDSSDDEIIKSFPDFLVSEKPDTEYVNLFLDRAKKVPEISELVRKLLDESPSQIEASSNFLNQKFRDLKSDLSRLVVWKLSTEVDSTKIKTEKPRIRSIFKVLGKEYNVVYKRVVAGLPKGNETEKFNLATVTARIKK